MNESARLSMPPFSSVLKSRDVEDPVNLWIHRPLAYLFAWAVFRTPMTPNHVTLLATIVGLAAVPFILIGTPQSLLLGGALIWLGAILDGADGILARAKRMSSELGRALDGAADFFVAIPVMLAVVYHIFEQRGLWIEMVLVVIAVVSTVAHVYLYDFYKESYMMMSRPDWNGEFERVKQVRERLARIKAEGRSLVFIITTGMYLGLVQVQTKVIRWTNPGASREGFQFSGGPVPAEVYRRYNRGPIKLWRWVSLAPHSYLLAICCMLDQLHVYLWGRVFVINAVFFWAFLWQRLSTQKTQRAWTELGVAPTPVGTA